MKARSRAFSTRNTSARKTCCCSRWARRRTSFLFCRRFWSQDLGTLLRSLLGQAWEKTMSKKDLGLLILILVVGAVVAIINPRFLLPINLANTSNLIGLFGILSIGQAFVIITGGIELSVG